MRLDSTEASLVAKGMEAATTAIQKATPIQLASRPVTSSASLASCASKRALAVDSTA